jgi:pSer/pThr/pTyr-binding forkhead associated (FHA) protein
MKSRIRLINGPLAGQTVEVGTKLVVGRDADCSLRLPGEFVSRHHCALKLEGITLRILDLGSKNGTFVNGHRIAAGEAILLHDADVVSVGETTFIIELNPQPEDSTNPSAPSSAELKRTGLLDSRTVEDGPAPPAQPTDKPQEGQHPLA